MKTTRKGFLIFLLIGVFLGAAAILLGFIMGAELPAVTHSLIQDASARVNSDIFAMLQGVFPFLG